MKYNLQRISCKELHSFANNSSKYFNDKYFIWRKVTASIHQKYDLHFFGPSSIPPSFLLFYFSSFKNTLENIVLLIFLSK